MSSFCSSGGVGMWASSPSEAGMSMCSHGDAGMQLSTHSVAGMSMCSNGDTGMQSPRSSSNYTGMSRKIIAFIIILACILLPQGVNAAAKKSAQKSPPKPTPAKTQPQKSVTKPSIDAQIAAEERKRADLTKQVQKYRQQIKNMGQKVEGLLTKVNTLQQDESMAEQELTLLELQGQKIQENIGILDAHIKAQQAKIDELSEQMEDRVLDIYKYGQSGRMRTLFASRSVLEAADMAHLLKILNQRDEDILSQLQERIQNLDMSRKTMDDQQNRLIEKTQAVADQREDYNEKIKETNSFIKSIQRQKALAEKAVKEAEEAQKEAGAMIARLQRQRTKVYFPSGQG